MREVGRWLPLVIGAPGSHAMSVEVPARLGRTSRRAGVVAGLVAVAVGVTVGLLTVGGGGGGGAPGAGGAPGGSGSSGHSQPSASPSASETPLRELPSTVADDADTDPRCQAQYGDEHRVLEREHKVRPDGFPRTPPTAVLCRLAHVSADEEVGYYATDPGTKIFDIFWYHDHEISAGVADYAPIGGGQQILTGVVGDASFYVEQDAFDRYYIVWARDGNYDDDYVISP